MQLTSRNLTNNCGNFKGEIWALGCYDQQLKSGKEYKSSTSKNHFDSLIQGWHQNI